MENTSLGSLLVGVDFEETDEISLPSRPVSSIIPSKQQAHVERRQRRGRPVKPDPVTLMTREALLDSEKVLTVTVHDGDEEIARFQTQTPRQTKAGKVGWVLSRKMFVDVDGTSLACQMTGNVYVMLSNKWAT